jgi:hypothetical protein
MGKTSSGISLGFDGNGNKLPSKLNLNEKLKPETSNSSQRNIKYSKEIEINMKKLSLNRNITERYNKASAFDNENDSIIFPELPETLKKRLEAVGTDRHIYTPPRHVNSNNQIIEFIPITEILKESTRTNVMNDLKVEEQTKIKNTLIRNNDFRTQYEDVSESAKFKFKVDNTKIASNNIGLIQYMYEKDFLPKSLLNKVYSSNEEKQWKLNKVCQKVFKQRQLEKLHQNILAKKLQAKINKKKVEYYDEIKSIGDDMNNTKRLFNIHKPLVYKKDELFEDKMNDLHLHWEKINTNRYLHKSKAKSVVPSIN